MQLDKDIDIARLDAELASLLRTSRVGMVLGMLATLVAFFLYAQKTRALPTSSRYPTKKLLEAERDMLESQVRERMARLAERAMHLQQAVEDERAHLARELRDELGALLIAAKLNVARVKSKLPTGSEAIVEQLQHLTDTLNQGIALKRRTIGNLRPSSLPNLGLVTALDILAREFADRSDLKINTALEPVSLNTNRKLTIYRVAQEALTSIDKYAKATQVAIKLENYPYRAEISVFDNGTGFDPSQLPQTTHGLLGMRRHIEASGRQLHIHSRPGKGTQIFSTSAAHNHHCRARTSTSHQRDIHLYHRPCTRTPNQCI